MEKVRVDRGACIGCGLCVLACSRGLIQLEAGKARVEDALCNECGHCFAVCLTEAISLPSFEGQEILPREALGGQVEPDKLLALQKGRRSIRYFKDQDVAQEDLDRIIEAGRFAPTASNNQANRFIVLGQSLDKVRELALEALVEAGERMDPSAQNSAYYKEAFGAMLRDYQEEGKDGLFFKAPRVILIVGRAGYKYKDIDGAIAGSRMELQANSQGLGACFIGFFKEALENSPALRTLIGLEEGEDLVLTMVLGHPMIEYKRSVGRKPANVTYL